MFGKSFYGDLKDFMAIATSGCFYFKAIENIKVSVSVFLMFPMITVLLTDGD